MWALNNNDPIHPMTAKRIKQVFKTFNPKTEDEKIALCAIATNGYVWEQEYAELNIEHLQNLLASTEFLKYPCYVREDFEKFLMKFGKSASEAHQISEGIRKGYLIKQPDRMIGFDIPEEILTIGKNYCYVTSRAAAEKLWLSFKQNMK